MDSNPQDAEASRKRSHDEFEENIGAEYDKENAPDGKSQVPPTVEPPPPAGHSPNRRIKIEQDPLTDPPQPSTVPSIVVTGNDNDAATQSEQPAKKKKKLTPEEEAAKAEETRKLEERKKKIEEEKKIKAEERQMADEEKKKKTEERQRANEEKKKKAEERQKFNEERKRLNDEKKQAAEEKKKQKDEEQRRKLEAEEKKTRSQLKLVSFFTSRPASRGPASGSSPAPPASDNAVASSPQPQPSGYEMMFMPFFLKRGTTLAPAGPTLTAAGARRHQDAFEGAIAAQQRDPASAALLPDLPPAPILTLCERFRAKGKRPPIKGRSFTPMRIIYEGMMAAADKDDHAYAEYWRGKLSRVPFKFIAFGSDVRPPYIGTWTQRINMRRVARNPCTRQAIHVDYDYDSEAEWVEDDGDGDGDDVDMDDDDEEDDADEDMTEFLDDSEDLGPARRVFGSGGQDLVPITTGICYEDGHGNNPNESLRQYSMELLVVGVGDRGIDPFSTEYWPGAAPPRPPAPVSAKALAQTDPTANIAPQKYIERIKTIICENRELKKSSLEDIIYKSIDGLTKVQVKATIPYLAFKVKAVNIGAKVWAIKHDV